MMQALDAGDGHFDLEVPDGDASTVRITEIETVPFLTAFCSSFLTSMLSSLGEAGFIILDYTIYLNIKRRTNKLYKITLSQNGSHDLVINCSDDEIVQFLSALASILRSDGMGAVSAFVKIAHPKYDW